MDKPKKNKRIKKPWGYEDIWAKTDNYVGKLIHIKMGESLSLQYHEEKEETIRVISGRLYVEFRHTNNGGQEVSEYYVLNKGDSLHIPPTQIHRFFAEAGDVDLIEVSTTQLDDVYRIEDKYGRQDGDLMPYVGPVS